MTLFTVFVLLQLSSAREALTLSYSHILSACISQILLSICILLHITIICFVMHDQTMYLSFNVSSSIYIISFFKTLLSKQTCQLVYWCSLSEMKPMICVQDFLRSKASSCLMTTNKPQIN